MLADDAGGSLMVGTPLVQGKIERRKEVSWDVQSAEVDSGRATSAQKA